LVNKSSPETRIKSKEINGEIAERLERILKHPVIGVIPCYCDVLQAERTTLLAVEKPNHPFVENLEKVAEKLEKII
jgi:hypothetical protein